MKAAKKKASKVADFFAALLRTAYFPRELPPAITARHFAEFCKLNYPVFKSQQNILISRTTNYETFTAPRSVLARRNLALVHPLAQAGLSLLITESTARRSEKSSPEVEPRSIVLSRMMRSHLRLLGSIFKDGELPEQICAQNVLTSWRPTYHGFSTLFIPIQFRGP
jgi:hypothetical protein